MAVPSLAAMAGLTLFHMQQEWREGMTKGGVTPKMSLAQPPFNSDTHVYASRIQRRQRRRRGAVTRIAAALRGFFFCVCSLLNKPTAPENGTHHTAAVKKSAAKQALPPFPPHPSPSLSPLDPRRGTRSTSVSCVWLCQRSRSWSVGLPSGRPRRRLAGVARALCLPLPGA